MMAARGIAFRRTSFRIRSFADSTPQNRPHGDVFNGNRKNALEHSWLDEDLARIQRDDAHGRKRAGKSQNLVEQFRRHLTRIQHRARVVDDQVGDRIEVLLVIIAKPIQPPLVRRDVECSSLAGTDVAMVTQLSGVIGADTARGMVAEHKREPPPYRSRTGSKRISGRGIAAANVNRDGSSANASVTSTDKVVSQKKGIDLGPPKRLQSILGRGNQRFLIVERRVEHKCNVRKISKSTDQGVKHRIVLRIDDLYAASPVSMHHRRNQRRPIRADRIRQDHDIPAGVSPIAVGRDVKPLVRSLGKNRRAEGTKTLAVFDAAIERISELENAEDLPAASGGPVPADQTPCDPETTRR